MSRKHFPVEGKRIWVCGHRGSALRRRLRATRCELLTADRRALDLTRQADVLAWLSTNRPEPVNIGPGNQVSIRTIAETIGGITGYDGRLKFDASESAYRYVLEHVAHSAPTQNEPQAAAIHHA